MNRLDYIDPAIGIPMAIILWGFWLFCAWYDDRKARRRG